MSISVPPQVIRVKRKATEESPVSYLRVQETKRHRSSVFVYQRQNEKATVAESIPLPTQAPVIHTSRRGRQATAFHGSSGDGQVHPGQDNATSTTATSSSTNALDSASTSEPEPRRFHMSREDMLLAALGPYPIESHAGTSKKRSAPALFVERKIKRISSERLHAASNAAPGTPTTADTPTGAVEAMDVDVPSVRKFKKPGAAKLAARQSLTQGKPDLPKSMTNRWNVDMEQMTADMADFAMQLIARNLKEEAEKSKAEAEKSKAREEKSKAENALSSTPSRLKYKPKPPVKSHVERHSEGAAQADQDMADVDVENSDSDNDYIIETYVRVPASSMGDDVRPQSVGLLVFDAEPDVEYFYAEEDSSEDEFAEDEEDENAENYYGADYPDEEVDTDDEFDKFPYAFRTDNASDLEEYDLDDESDDPFDEDKDEDGYMRRYKAYIGQRNGVGDPM